MKIVYHIFVNKSRCSIVYHQATGKCTLKRDEIQGRQAALDDLMSVADNGDVMPPKSTWFEPKLRSGLLIHKI